jgi:hypothetical protein
LIDLRLNLLNYYDRCKNGKIEGGGGRQLCQRDEEGGGDGEGKRTVVKRVAATEKERWRW